MTGLPQPPSKSSSEFYPRSSQNSRPSPPRSRPSLRTSAPEIPPISNVFSDEFSLEPLSGQSSPVSTVSSDRTSIGARSHAADNGRSPYLRSPFEDSSEILSDSQEDEEKEEEEVKEMPPPTPELDRRYVPTELASVARAPSSASSMGGSAPSTAHRSMSTSSRFSMPRAMSPYTGQTGPSHPYAMYTQGTAMGRASSVSSTSTVRPVERSQITAPPPQHPYALYSQNTVPEEAFDESGPIPPIIPIGFPGQEPVFHDRPVPVSRPDEVGDIIGPDGHTEQLPPYSRYPDALPPKHEYPEHPAIPGTANPGTPNPAPVSPDSGVSEQTILAGQTSVAAAGAGTTGAAVAPNEAAAAPDDPSGGFKETLARRTNKKVCCGVPIWMFLLLGGVLVLGGAIGGVIGGLLGSEKGRSDATRETETIIDRPMTTGSPTPSPILDAIPLNMDDIEGTLPPLPTHDNWVVPANTITAQSNSCVNDSAYSNTWQCLSTRLFPFGLHLANNISTISLGSPDLLDGSIIYGAQRPIMEFSNFTLKLAWDSTMRSLGPTLFFFTPFDKLVVIHEDDFPAISPEGSVGESEVVRRSTPPTRDDIAGPGDRPWFCWWNSTFLETFIYINQTTSATVNLNTTGTDLEGLEPTRTSKSVPLAIPSTEIASPTRTASSSFFSLPIKFKETRFARNNPPPYCEQRQILDTGQLGEPLSTTVVIEEVETGEEPEVSGPYPGLGHSYTKRDRDDKVPCFCQWLYS